MKKAVILTIIITGFIFITVPVSSQDKKTDAFFIDLEDISGLFVEKDNTMMIETLYLQNFPDGKSAKPLHSKINAMKEVVNFGIASDSETQSGQRRCYLEIKKYNYVENFRKVLNAIPVEYIILDGTELSVEDFIKKIKS
jgi:hypothetical protein